MPPQIVFGPEPEQAAAGPVAGRCRPGDWIARQITSNPYADSRAIALSNDAFADGGLRRTSYARPGKLFTASKTLFAGCAGSLTRPFLENVRDAVIELIRG
jgi:mRNA interferase MazF